MVLAAVVAQSERLQDTFFTCQHLDQPLAIHPRNKTKREGETDRTQYHGDFAMAMDMNEEGPDGLPLV